MFDPADFGLDDQVAVVTGVAAGIGRAIAEPLPLRVLPSWSAIWMRMPPGR